MAAPLRVEQRLTALEARMTALEQLPVRMDRLATEMVELRAEMRDEFAAVRGEIASVDARLAARIDDSRRETRVLHEDVIARIAVLGEGLAAHGQTLAGLSAETRAMFDTVSARLAAIEDRLPVARRRKRAD